jgi:hypothetical protein
MAMDPFAIKSNAPMMDATAGMNTTYLVRPKIFLMIPSLLPDET